MGPPGPPGPGSLVSGNNGVAVEGPKVGITLYKVEPVLSSPYSLE